jgi:hypothetical protein
MTLVNSRSISSVSADPRAVLAAIISTWENLGRRPTTSDVVARNFRSLAHHLEHSRDDLLQEIRLFADGVRESQNAIQTVQKT